MTSLKAHRPDVSPALTFSHERGPAWQYAKDMKMALIGLLPEGFTVQMSNGIYICGTVTTTQEAEAVREIIRHLGTFLPSHRVMVAGDIGVEPETVDWGQEAQKLLGDFRLLDDRP